MSMSGLEDLYREIILDHYRNPRNRGHLEVPPSHRVEAYNPLCGDEVAVYLQVNNGVLEDIKIEGQGCSISQSSASLMSAAVKGKTLEEIRRAILDFKSLMSIHETSLGNADDDPSSSRDNSNVADIEEGVKEDKDTDSESASRRDSRADGEAAGSSHPGDDIDGTSDDYREDMPVDLDALGELAALQGVVRFPVRIKCAILAWNALAQGLEEILADV
ncbi:MAG: Fe-S cluster assembly sulfur transfer protein SufU [Acidimicrobiales bacterium]